MSHLLEITAPAASSIENIDVMSDFVVVWFPLPLSLHWFSLETNRIYREMLVVDNSVIPCPNQMNWCI